MYKRFSKMVLVSKKKIDENDPHAEKSWGNPTNPEKASDHREEEQIERQLEEAERRKENLTEEPEN